MSRSESAAMAMDTFATAMSPLWPIQPALTHNSEIILRISSEIVTKGSLALALEMDSEIRSVSPTYLLRNESGSLSYSTLLLTISYLVSSSSDGLMDMQMSNLSIRC